MHAWAFRGSCSSVIPCHRHLVVSKMVVGVGKGGGAQRETKRSRCLQRGVRVYWMLERCGGDTVEIMQMRRSVKQSWTRLTRRHFGTKITWVSSWSQNTWSDLSAKMLREPQPCSLGLGGSPHHFALKNNSTLGGISGTSSMATPACKWGVWRSGSLEKKGPW